MTARADTYGASLDAIAQIVEDDADPAEVLAKAVAVLAERFDRYSWVGIYLIDGDDLVLGPWRGPQATEHTRIAIGRGVCGAAAASGKTEIIDDVASDDRYLACFPSTRSEIVVPISHEGRTVGEIDIDSDEPAAFGREDSAFLENVAGLVSHAAANARR